MKTTKRSGARHLDDALPRKVDAPATGKAVALEAAARPSSDGPRKSDDAPRVAGDAVKPEAGATQRPRAVKHADFGDQVPIPAGPDGGQDATGEQYVRLRVRMRGDRLTVLDSHLVDGPLSQAQGFSTANVYELTLGDRLLHAGELPDLGEQRSFVRPDAPDDGHFTTERPIVEFTARLRAQDVTPDTLPRIALRVHRIKEEARDGLLGAAPLAERFPREVRPVAELVGLPDSVLPDAIEARGGRTPRI